MTHNASVHQCVVLCVCCDALHALLSTCFTTYPHIVANAFMNLVSSAIKPVLNDFENCVCEILDREGGKEEVSQRKKEKIDGE